MNHLNRYTYRLGKRLYQDESFVLIREEFGYRYWFWFPEVSKTNLIKIWKNTSHIDKFNFRCVLPGKFILASDNYHNFNMWCILDEHKATWYANIFDETDTFLKTTFPYRIILHKGANKARREFQREMEEEEKQAIFDQTMMMCEMDPDFYSNYEKTMMTHMEDK